MRRTFIWIELLLAALVVVGVFLQVYFIAAYFFGEADALDAHEAVGGITHGVEVLVFLAALPAWWGIRWGLIGHAFSLPVIGTIQLIPTESDGWVGGLHGLLALFVLAIAASIVSINLRHLRSGDRPATPVA
jgi:hypothetical protein